MKERVRGLLILAYQLLDLSALCFALWLAFYLGGPQGVTYLVRAVVSPTPESTVFVLGVLVSWAFLLSRFWLYRSKRLASGKDEVIDAFRAVAFCTLILATLILVAEWSVFPKRFLMIFATVSFVLLLAIRFVKRWTLREFRLHGRNLRNVVVVGAGPRGRRMVELIEQNPEIGYKFLGFIDDEFADSQQMLGSLNNVGPILSRTVVDEIIICLPIKTFYDRIESIAHIAGEQGITVRVYSDLFNLKLVRSDAGEIGEAPIMSLYPTKANRWQHLVKSGIDFVGGLVLLFLCSPLLIAIAIAIKLTSSGPAIFVQERVGFNKRRFKMFKFRTMVVDAEQQQHVLEKLNEASGPVFKMRDDPRVTKVGRWLRKTSLDELPQLINIVLGDLSLVGPRPLPERDFRRFDQAWFNRRFSVKPGVTCIWQISGRSETGFDKWIMQDLEYIDRWSLILDLKILFKTIPTVIRGTGAM